MDSHNPVNASIESYDRWELPALDAHASTSTWQLPKNEAPGLSFPTVQELEAIRHAAQQEGIDQGLKQGQQQISEAVSRLAAVAGELSLQLQDQQFKQQMTALVMKICQVVLQRELTFNTQQIQHIVEQALTLLPANTPQVTVFLHPQDLALINTHKATLPAWRAEWSLKTNAQLAPGGCVVESAKICIDASVEQRFYEVVSALFAGDEDCTINLGAEQIFKDPLQTRSEFLVPIGDVQTDSPA